MKTRTVYVVAEDQWEAEEAALRLDSYNWSVGPRLAMRLREERAAGRTVQVYPVKLTAAAGKAQKGGK